MAKRLSIPDHIHTYQRTRIKKNDWRKQIYRCIHPDCFTYNRAELLTGKRAACTKCGQTMILNYEQLRHRIVNPVCFGCSKSKKKPETPVFESLLDDLFSEKTEETRPLEEEKNERTGSD